MNTLSARYGTLFVIAAGNSGPGDATVESPGSADAALTARVFVAELGLTPAAYVERIRVEAAQQYLEVSGATLEVVAKAAGFRTAETMRRAFHRVLGTAPGAFREAVMAWSRRTASPAPASRWSR